MANPVFITCAEDTWIKVASSVTVCSLWRAKTSASYKYTYRDAGETAPTDRAEGVPIFVQEEQDKELLTFKSQVDVYVMALSADGKVRYDEPSGSVLNAVISESGGGLVQTSFPSNAILKGQAFTIETVFDIAAGDDNFEIVFDTRNMTRRFISFPTIWSTSSGPIVITLSVCAGYTGGTQIIPTNRNYEYQASYQSEIDFYYDVTTTGCVASDTKILVGSKSTNQNSGGGSISSNLEIRLETGLIYVFGIDNQSGDAIKLYFLDDWFEV